MLTDIRLVCIPTVCRDYTKCFSSFWSDVRIGGGADLGIKEARDKDQVGKKASGEGKRIQTVCLSLPCPEEGHTLSEPRPKLHPYSEPHSLTWMPTSLCFPEPDSFPSFP